MKVVINDCYGGFGLSPAAVKRFAELQGRPCHFFTYDMTQGFKDGKYIPFDLTTPAGRLGMFTAFDIPNPNEVFAYPKDWSEMTLKERQAHNQFHSKHEIESRPENRADPLLIQVVEELGEAANGSCAKLKIVEIPDGTDYTIEEYDGQEHIAERHRTWS